MTQQGFFARPRNLLRLWGQSSPERKKNKQNKKGKPSKRRRKKKPKKSADEENKELFRSVKRAQIGERPDEWDRFYGPFTQVPYKSTFVGESVPLADCVCVFTEESEAPYERIVSGQKGRP